MSKPIAYLYHDAVSAQAANPFVDSTLLVMAPWRRPELRNETPLVTMADFEAALLASAHRYAPLMQAVEWLLDDGHMNQEHLARLRAAWEGAQQR